MTQHIFTELQQSVYDLLPEEESLAVTSEEVSKALLNLFSKKPGHHLDLNPTRVSAVVYELRKQGWAQSTRLPGAKRHTLKHWKLTEKAVFPQGQKGLSTQQRKKKGKKKSDQSSTYKDVVAAIEMLEEAVEILKESIVPLLTQVEEIREIEQKMKSIWNK